MTTMRDRIIDDLDKFLDGLCFLPGLPCGRKGQVADLSIIPHFMQHDALRGTLSLKIEPLAFPAEMSERDEQRLRRLVVSCAATDSPEHLKRIAKRDEQWLSQPRIMPGDLAGIWFSLRGRDDAAHGDLRACTNERGWAEFPEVDFYVEHVLRLDHAAPQPIRVRQRVQRGSVISLAAASHEAVPEPLLKGEWDLPDGRILWKVEVGSFNDKIIIIDWKGLPNTVAPTAVNVFFYQSGETIEETIPLQSIDSLRARGKSRLPREIDVSAIQEISIEPA